LKIEEDIEQTNAKRNKPDPVTLRPQPIISKIDLDQNQQILTTQISQQAQIIQVNTTPVQQNLAQNVPQNDAYGNRKIVPKIPTSYSKVVQPGIYPGFTTSYIQSENTSGILVPVNRQATVDGSYIASVANVDVAHAPDDLKLTIEDTNVILEVLGLDLDEIANINRQVLAHKVDKSFLNAHQKTLVWEIRRKNKNRLAAAKCRKRKLEDITINSESKEELTADFIALKKQNRSMRMEMKFEEELLVSKLAEYEELSPEWRVIKMALEEIKIVLSQDEIQLEDEIENQDSESISPIVCSANS